MPRVLVLTHTPTTTTGWLGDVLDEAGVEQRVHAMYNGHEPEVDPADAVVVMGGPMGAYQEDRHPFLAAEKALLRRLVAADVPVLGVCLGSQLLADALGGRAYLAERPEVAYLTPTLTPAGRADPVTSTLEDPVLLIHQDTFDLPPGAELLARSDGYLHAFRLGSALGFQFHAEAGPGVVAEWLERPGLQGLVRRGGREPAEVRAEAEERAEQAGAQGRRLFAAWAEHVLGV